MIDMEVRWSDGWKAGNVLQIYEKAVVNDNGWIEQER